MRKYLTIIVMVTMGFNLTACVSKRQYSDLNMEFSQRLQEVTQQRNQYQDELIDLQTQHHSLQRQHDDLQNKHVSLQNQYDNLQNQLKTLQDSAEDHESQLSLKQKLEQRLKDQIVNQTIKIEALEGLLKLTLVDKILFESGSAQINDQGQETLLKVAESVNLDRDHSIRVDGHTDNVPIGGTLRSAFPTNWELSTARATAVVRFLQDQGKIKPERLSASGYSYYQPVESNDNEAGRQQNRRIEIILAPLSPQY